MSSTCTWLWRSLTCSSTTSEPMAKMQPLAVNDSGQAVSLEDLDIEAFGLRVTNNSHGGS